MTWAKNKGTKEKGRPKIFIKIESTVKLSTF